ncbi:MAG: response regulator transcription factor [Pseudobutyrivibrio sp.]|nr:response regulator transcription factor [Pseudobutyrivibrio sp.]
MVNIFVCDDMEVLRSVIIELIDKYVESRNIAVKYMEYGSGEDLIADADKIGAEDLIIMDYMLGKEKLNGIETVEKLRELEVNAKVTFLTDYDYIVYDAIRVGIHRFMRKFVMRDEMDEMLTSYFESLDKNRMLTIKSGYDVYYIKKKTITYIESMRKKCTIYYNYGNKSVTTNKSISEIEGMLDPEIFLRCHKSYIVNIKNIVNIIKQEAEACDGSKIPISREKRMEVEFEMGKLSW